MRFLGMSVEMLDRVYGHHHPGHLRTAARAIGYRPRQSLAESLARTRAPRRPPAQAAEKAGGGRSHGRTRLSLHFRKGRGDFVQMQGRWPVIAAVTL